MMDEENTQDDSQALAEFEALEREYALETGEQIGSGEQEQPEKTIETADAIYAIIAPMFDLLAPNWNVRHEEKRALADSYGTLIDELLPDTDLGRWGSVIAAAGVTYSVLMPRIGTPRKREEKEVNAAEEHKANDAD